MVATMLGMAGNFLPIVGIILFFILQRAAFCSKLCTGESCKKAFPFTVLIVIAAALLIIGGFKGLFFLRLILGVVYVIFGCLVWSKDKELTESSAGDVEGQVIQVVGA